MNLKELQVIIDKTIERLRSYQKPEDIRVLITLSESSMGARASSDIKYGGLGIDWEHGQFRLEPVKPLVRKGDSLLEVKSVICKSHEGRNYYICPTCRKKINKNDAYCRHCSQRLK